jgi:outer membrane protein TolC
VSLALNHHPAIGEARAEIEVAEGVLRQAGAARFPSVLSDASLVRHEEPYLVAPLHGFDPTMAPDFDRSLVRGNLTLGYSIYDGGARGARIAQAESGRALASAGRTSSELAITAETSAAFLEVLSTAELLKAAASQRETLEAEVVRVEQFLEAGKAARVELLRVQAALSQAEATEISLRSRLGVVQGRLARLTGLDSEEVREVDLVPVRLRAAPAPMLPQVLERARSVSPELELARQRLAGTAAGVEVARASLYPTLEAAGAYSEFGSLSGGHTLEWQGSLRVSFPIFTGGARRGDRDRASAEMKKATEALRSAELAVEGGVEEALAAAQETRAMRVALESAVEQAAEVARIEALALEVGSGIQTDFLRAQSELFQARAALSQARHGEVMAGVQLARVTGELTLDWLQENMEVIR